MENPRLAGRYAKSLIDIAVERNELDKVHDDVRYLQEVCKSSREFVNMLKSPVVPSDKKVIVLQQITSGKVTEVTAAFNKLIVAKNREEALPEILAAFIDQYNKLKGIHRVKLTTAVGISDKVKNLILDKIRRDTPLQNIELETKLNPDLIGGFVLEFNNNLLDASIQRDLREIRAQFDKNVFEHQLR